MGTATSRLLSLALLTTTLGAFACGPLDDDELGPSGHTAGIDLGTASDALTVCANGPLVEGIDVSYYQGNIRWNEVATEKAFAIARLAYGTSIDSTFDQNWAGIKNAGMIRGAYQWFRPMTDPIVQANVVINKLGRLGPGDLPVMADVEDPGTTPGSGTYAANLQRWVDRITEGTGKAPMIYTGYYYWRDKLADTAQFTNLPLVHAQYTTASCPNITAWPTWTMWQYRADPYPGIPAGRCAGIDANVDLDHFNGSLDDLRRLAGVVTNHPPRGYLDTAGCDAIQGWAQDVDSPDAPIAVHIYIGGPAGSGAAGYPITADLHRDDLCNAIGSCKHGFSLRTPAGFKDGQARPIYAYGIDSGGGENPLLGAAPLNLQCARPNPSLGPQDGIKRHIASPEVLAAWGFDFNDVVVLSDAEIGAYTEASPFPNAPQLAWFGDDPKVEVLDGSALRWVMNPDVMIAWRFSFGAVQRLPGEQAAGYVPGAPLPNAPFLARGSGPAVYILDAPPALWAEPGASDWPAHLTAGETREVTVRLTNRGALTWTAATVQLAASNPRDRASALCPGAGWISCMRPASVAADTARGAVGEFRFSLKAPATPGTLQECFNLVYGGSHWFSEAGALGPSDTALCFDLVVDPAPVDPPVGPGTGSGGNPQQPGNGGAEISAGCSASGAAAPMALMLPALLGFGLLRRRRRGCT